MRKTVIILIAVTMIAVSACGSSKKSSAPTTAGTAGTPVGTTAITTASTEVATSASGTTAGTVGTTAPSTSSTFPPVDVNEQKCLYRKRILLTVGQVPNPDAFGLKALSNDDLAALDNIDADMRGALTAAGVTVSDIGDQDPLQVAATINANTDGVIAAPELLTTDSGHWTFAPGSDAQASQVAPPAPSASPDSAAPLVAVVDTGYTAPGPKDTEVPAWLKDWVEPLDATVDADVATGRNQGHGRFVASIIVEQAKNAKVVVAAMKDFNPDLYYGYDQVGPNGNKAVWNDIVASNKAEDGYTTDELQMFGAVWRLIQSKKPFTALNLSVGSYQCSALDVSGLAILAALKIWQSSYPNAPVIAAAGNHTSSVTAPVTGFIPGQLDLKNLPQEFDFKNLHLIGVQSVQPNGITLSAFSNAAATSAIGEGLLGIRLDGEPGAYWCGSSFATAIVTANLVASKPLDDRPSMPMDATKC